MAALMEVPVKFIWTHDAFRVGEDGPTHEPVEQEAQILSLIHISCNNLLMAIVYRNFCCDMLSVFVVQFEGHVSG